MELINIGEEDDLGKFISSEVDDHALARRLQEEEEAQARPTGLTNQDEEFARSLLLQSESDNTIESDELIEPVPDIHALFTYYNDKHFQGKLSVVEVKWSEKMTRCAGICEFKRGACVVKLSQPLLKFRPRKDLISTLLHEMIHAYHFVTRSTRRLQRDDHGDDFKSWMNHLNIAEGANIDIFHNFREEVDLYLVHWWTCGKCEKVIKRSMNRAPSHHDFWWEEHTRKCGGSFLKTKEPIGFADRNSKRKRTSPKPNSNNNSNSIGNGNGNETLNGNGKRSAGSSSVVSPAKKKAAAAGTQSILKFVKKDFRGDSHPSSNSSTHKPSTSSTPTSSPPSSTTITLTSTDRFQTVVIPVSDSDSDSDFVKKPKKETATASNSANSSNSTKSQKKPKVVLVKISENSEKPKPPKRESVLIDDVEVLLDDDDQESEGKAVATAAEKTNPQPTQMAKKQKGAAKKISSQHDSPSDPPLKPLHVQRGASQQNFAAPLVRKGSVFYISDSDEEDRLIDRRYSKEEKDLLDLT